MSKYILIGILLFINVHQAHAQIQPSGHCDISMGNYQELRNNMTITDVTQILGCQGIEDTNALDGEYIVMSWMQKYPYAVILGTFHYGRLIKKSQIGIN